MMFCVMQALIVLPTRELANQVADVVKLFASSCGLKYAALYGGASKIHQMSQLRRGTPIYMQRNSASRLQWSLVIIVSYSEIQSV